MTPLIAFSGAFAGATLGAFLGRLACKWLLDWARSDTPDERWKRGVPR